MADSGDTYYRPYTEEKNDEDGEDGEDGQLDTIREPLDDEEQDLADDDIEMQREDGLDTENILDLIASPDFRKFAEFVASAGPSFQTTQKQLAFGKNRIGKKTNFSSYEDAFKESDSIKKLPGYGKTTVETRDVTNNPILIDSTKRDRRVYPQPTFFSTRLPRVYKNITALNFAEVSFLNRFYYFRPEKNNISIQIQELDRQPFTVYIRQGSYSISQLKAELELQLNRTPLFYDFASADISGYTQSYNDFYKQFSLTKDFSLNFNYPGSNFYNNYINQFEMNPTMTGNILPAFWSGTTSQNLGTNVGKEQIFMAYYYPLLKEALQDEGFTGQIDLNPGLNIDPTITTIDQVRTRIINNFQGLNPMDTVVYTVANYPTNISALDVYRFSHTFRNSLVNAYSVSISPQDSRITISAKSLNKSLVDLITYQYNIFLTNSFSNYNISYSNYIAAKSNIGRLDSIISDMYQFTQTQFANYWAVPYGTYTNEYYSIQSNSVKLRNGLEAFGIPDSPSSSSEVSTINVDILDELRVPPKIQWPYMSTLSSINTVYMSSLSNVERGDLNHPYNFITETFDLNFPVIDISGGTGSYHIVPNLISNKVDCVVPISPGQYTTFKFHSPVRQTLQVETLQRPIQYRYPDYNQAYYDSTINHFFSTTYTYDISAGDVFPVSNPTRYTIAYDNLYSAYLKDVPSWTSSNTDRWLTSYSESKAFFTSNAPLQATSVNGTNAPWLGLFYKFVTPDVSGASSSNAYRYPLNITAEIYDDISGSTLKNPADNFRMFIYSDRAGLQGDLYTSSLTYTNFRSENPFNYKYSTVVTTMDTSGTIQINAYPGQTYYISMRADTAEFGSIYTRIFPWFSSNASTNTIVMTRGIAGMNPLTDAIDISSVYLSNYNYASVYDYDALALPSASTLWGPSPTSNASSYDYAISTTAIGYDLSGVSNDYLDYIPYNAYMSTFTFDPTKNLGFDPITRYQFQSNSPYNTTDKTYFYSGSSNTIYRPATAGKYTPTTIPYRQDKIVHYYSPNYISEPGYVIAPAEFEPVSNLVVDGPAQKPYTSTSTAGPIPGYLYDTSGHLNLNFGTLGFTFAPTPGQWSIDKIQLRSAIASSNISSDPNSAVKYLGIFKTADIYQTQFVNFSMSTAIAVLSNYNAITYDPRTEDFDISDDPANAGFDIRGGTYYNYKWDSSFVSPIRGSTIEGYSQTLGQITNDPSNLYSIVCLDSNYEPTTFKAMSGSIIPYPFHNQISTGYTYMDTNIGDLNPDTGALGNRGLAYPSTIITDLSQTEWEFLDLSAVAQGLYGPPPGYNDGSESLYLQSMPIGTSVLHTKRQNDPFTDVSGINPWLTQYFPNAVFMRGHEYIMMQATDYYIYHFSQTSTVYDISAGSLAYTLTESSIFDYLSGISLLAASSTHNDFIFLGVKATLTGQTAVLLKKFTPSTGTLYEVNPTIPIVLDISMTDLQYNSFTMHNDNTIIISLHSAVSDTTTLYYYDSITGAQVTGPNEESGVGKRWLHDQDPSGNGHFYTLEVDSSSGFGNKVTHYYGNLTDISAHVLIPEANVPSAFNGIAINSVDFQRYEDPILVMDDIILYSRTPGYTDYIYQVRKMAGPTDYYVDRLATQFVDASGSLDVQSVYGGFMAGFWATTDHGPLALWGNRNNATDLKFRIEAEWQIFYPYQKITLVQTGSGINPIVNTTGLEPGEYLHTNLFYYSDVSSYLADISGRWGLESNFFVADVSNRGYYFNSYIFDIPLQVSSGSDYQYLTVRGYSPTESGEVLMRFYCANTYSFGYATFTDISNEIHLYKTDPSSHTLFDPIYANVLSNFDDQYDVSGRKWGENPRASFGGSNYNTSNYATFISTYTSVYNEFRSTSDLINIIDFGVTSTLKNFINTDLRYILPSSASLRQNFTDPLPFKINWYSALPDTFKPLKENWGIGYNLGYVKADTGYATYHLSDSAYKITDDYIYLQLNTEENMNRLDICKEENYDKTLETTGEVNRYYAKLLLGAYNEKSRIAVQNTVQFSPPVSRLDKLTFTWVDQTGVILNNTECEWTATATITERKQVQLQNTNGPLEPSFA